MPARWIRNADAAFVQRHRATHLSQVTRINSADENSFAKEAKSTQDPQIKAYVQKFASMDTRQKQMGEALK